MNIQDQFISSHNPDMRDALMTVLDKSCQYNVRINTVDKRELEDINGKKLLDFASCNYLSFDQEQDRLLQSGVNAAKKYGIHTSRARLMGYHELFSEIEKKLSGFLGVEDTILFPNTTLAHIGIIPALMKKDDVIFLDKAAHATMYQGAQIARDKGTKIVSYEQDDFETLEALLKEHEGATRKMIFVDGVYSMTGNYAKLHALLPLAEKYTALLYVDDGHGFGFIGENPTDEMPYGFKGNGVVNYYGKGYENIMYVSGTAKNLAAAAAVVSVTPQMKRFLMAYAKPLDYTHPPTPFALGVLNAAIDLQLEIGDELRIKVYAMTKRLIDELRAMGLEVMNDTTFPIVSVLAGDTEKLVEASRKMYEKGIFLTSCPYPTMPKGEEALRITVTSNNTEEHIDHLLEAFNDIKDLLLA
jgi:8-amino-7-oxononanoate synthase